MAPKNVFAWMPESSFFGTFVHSQSVHGSQTLLKSLWQHVYAHFALIRKKLSQKTSLFVLCEFFGLFHNALAADHMYSRDNWGKFLQQVKTTLSQKAKRFFQIFITFLESSQILHIFQKKGQLCSLNSSEVIGSKKCGCLNARRLLFQNTIPQLKCSRVAATAEILLAGRLS